MADLVLAVGTSHSPALNSPAEDHAHHAERDMRNPNLLDKEGQPTSYDELLARANPALADQIAPEAIARRVAARALALAARGTPARMPALPASVFAGEEPAHV